MILISQLRFRITAIYIQVAVRLTGRFCWPDPDTAGHPARRLYVAVLEDVI